MRTKKLIALLLALVMVISLVACGEKTPAVDAPKDDAPKADAPKDETPEATPEESDEPVELSIMVANLAEIYEGSVSEKWSQYLEEKLNVKIEWVLPPTTAYEDTLQTMLIGDDKPDVFCFPTEWLNMPAFTDACEAGMFYDISEMLENYPDVVNHTHEMSWSALDIFNDGRIWGVPRSTVSRADGFALRKDWLENLGIEYTEGEMLTLDEFYDILYAFTYNDPDGNGIDDTYGLRAYANADGSLNTGLAQIFHIGNGEGWYELDDGTVANLKYSKDHDYYKQYLEFANKCWETGVMEPDAFALDENASWERLNSYGCYQSFPSNMIVEPRDNYFGRNDTDVYLPGVVLENDPIGGYTYGNYSSGIWNYYAISTTCEHPEKVLELFNYILSDEEWGNLKIKQMEGVSFTIDENGVYDLSLSNAMKEGDAKNGTNTADNSPLSLLLRRSDGAETYVDINMTPENQKRVAGLIHMALDLYWPTVDRGYLPEVVNDPVFIEYKNYLIQEEAKIISGDSPVENWDNLLNGFYEAGYEDYVADMLAYINSFKK